MHHIKIIPTLLLAVIFVLFINAGCTVRKYEIIELKCGRCHSSSIVYENKRSAGDWDLVVYGMKARGLSLSEEEEQELMKLLYNSLSIK